MLTIPYSHYYRVGGVVHLQYAQDMYQGAPRQCRLYIFCIKARIELVYCNCSISRSLQCGTALGPGPLSSSIKKAYQPQKELHWRVQ